MSIKDNSIYNDISTYLQRVEDECQNLIKICNIKYDLNLFDKEELLTFLSNNRIYEIQFEKNLYLFHGSGCTLKFEDGGKIKWDFGFENWWSGIDVFFAYDYIKSSLNPKYSIEELRFFCDECVKENVFYKIGSKYYIFYYKISSTQINFPSQYDSIIVSYNGLNQRIKRNKQTDRFIRKSTGVYSEISNLTYNYDLIFYLDEKPIFRVPYNEKAYPPNAVEIMSNQIIKPLFRKEQN